MEVRTMSQSSTTAHYPVSIPPHPHREPGEPWTVDTLVRELIWTQWGDDWREHFLQLHLIQLEHALINRKARRQLKRQLRQLARAYSWAGESFYARRVEAIANEYQTHDDSLRGAA
jgi:hypothetical protein